MEDNRQVTRFGVGVIVLACSAAVLQNIIQGEDHPILAALPAIGMIFAGVAVLTAINFLMFVPLFTFILRLYGKNRKSRP